MGRTIRTLLIAAVLTGATVVAGADTTEAASPTAESGSSDWRQVSIGNRHMCGIRTSGRLFCWGEDDSGQLGDGGGVLDRTVPAEVSGGGTNWRSVSAGGNHTCAIRAPGRLYCWGTDTSGELGNGTAPDDQTTPDEVAGGYTNWVSVSAGSFHTCGRRSTGRLFCWGSDAAGRSGNGPDIDGMPIPFEVAGRHTTWTSVSAGSDHTCGRRSSGRIYCWGRNFEGQVGDGGVLPSRQSPGLVAGGHTDWTSVTAGLTHTCGRRSTGRIYCWGADFEGQVGDGDDDVGQNQLAPTVVGGGAADWTSVTAGGRFSCGRRSSGRLYCWGEDDEGQRGDGGPTGFAHVPVSVAGGATDWGSIEAGDGTTCARTVTGRLYCWGDDASGQLGDGGTNTDQPRPTEVYA